jgi:phospholipid transport system substrate-binding protein
MRDFFAPVIAANAGAVARRAVLLGLMAFASLAATIPVAEAATPAETFVAENADKGLTILNNKHNSLADRTAQFQTFLEQLTDIDRIAKFTLGNARRTASPADIAAFGDAFRSYVIAVYQTRLTQYSGQRLKVTGSTERAPGDYIVSTIVVGGSSSNGQPLEVDFRVLGTDGKFVVIDASVAGIWLAIEERDQFSAFLGQNGGSIPKLAEHLQQLTVQLRSGKN